MIIDSNGHDQGRLSLRIELDSKPTIVSRTDEPEQRWENAEDDPARPQIHAVAPATRLESSPRSKASRALGET